MNIYNYENITYRVTGISVINDPKDTKQEGLLLRLRLIDSKGATIKYITMFIDKRCAAHITKMTKTGRTFWKRFRLPKMIKQ